MECDEDTIANTIPIEGERFISSEKWKIALYKDHREHCEQTLRKKSFRKLKFGSLTTRAGSLPVDATGDIMEGQPKKYMTGSWQGYQNLISEKTQC